jgi:hypothetical protein
MDCSRAIHKVLLLAICFVVPSAVGQSNSPVSSQAVADKPSVDSATSEEITANEQKFWDLLVAGDIDGLGNLLSPDFTSVSGQIRNRAVFLDDLREGFKSCPIAPVQVNHPQVNVVSPDVATIAYSGVIATTCKNRDVKITATTISIWVRRDGAWRMHLRSQLLANGFAVQSH